MGGLALFWKQDLNVEVLFQCDNYIDTFITYKSKRLFSTFVYGAPDQSQKKTVWNNLSTLASSCDVPWFLIGDFNNILDNSEKTRSPPRAEGSFCDLCTFMSQNDLYDLCHSGNSMSWRGNRHSHLIHCRLDRAISNNN